MKLQLQRASRRKYLMLTITLLFLVVCHPILTSAAAAEEPLQAVKRGIEEGIRILQDPLYKSGHLSDVQRQKLWHILQDHFDFGAFSRLVLAANWKQFSLQERQEFTTVFAKFIGDFYLSKLQQKYRGEQVRYLGEELISKKTAVVRLTVLWKGVNVPIEVRMLKKGHAWKAYDATALGVSGALLYRMQFKYYLLSHTPAQAIALLKKKKETLEKKLSQAPGSRAARLSVKSGW
ncbi:MAG: ABC transporter substrate-binding protein [Deltaproteobacteria bacterium]|nr:ABC transporter substrate-binding protein [Deltaproteobacteria bacterium]MBW2071645.1 ABC transporter substrate-binding protein [Deltaproteobacteria bacterium]